MSSGSGVEISAEALDPLGGKREVDDDDALALVNGDDVELDIRGLADNSTLTVSFTFADPDRPDCVLESRDIEIESGTTLSESSIPFDPDDHCTGKWTMTMQGDARASGRFEFTTPINLRSRKIVTRTLNAKSSYFFEGRSDRFHSRSTRKLTRLVRNIPLKSEVNIQVTGISVSMKNKKSNARLAKKRCERIEKYLRKALPGRDLNFESVAVGAQKHGADVTTKATVIRNKGRKPLTTVSISYTKAG